MKLPLSEHSILSLWHQIVLRCLYALLQSSLQCNSSPDKMAAWQRQGLFLLSSFCRVKTSDDAIFIEKLNIIFANNSLHPHKWIKQGQTLPTSLKGRFKIPKGKEPLAIFCLWHRPWRTKNKIEKKKFFYLQTFDYLLRRVLAFSEAHFLSRYSWDS